VTGPKANWIVYLVDLSLIIVSFWLSDQIRPWIVQHYQAMCWLLAPLQVAAVFAATIGFEAPKAPCTRKKWLASIYSACEMLYSLSLVLGVGSFLWLFFFLPNHPFGHIWSLGLALFGGILAFGIGSELREPQSRWQAAPIWIFLMVSESMLDLRWHQLEPSLAARLLGSVILCLSYLPLRLTLSSGKEISLWEIASAFGTVIFLGWNLG
jgi:hypothetical protein